MDPIDVYTRLIDILLYTPTSHGNIDAKDNSGLTPLCIAFKLNNPDCTNAFLDHGANPEDICRRIAELSEQDHARHDSAQMIVQRMIALRVARLLKDKTMANLSLDFGMRNGEQVIFEHDCHTELTHMTKVYIDHYTTLRDLMYKSDIALRPHLANDRLRKMLGMGVGVDQIIETRPILLFNYPRYGPVVRRIYRRALLRLKLIQEAREALKAIALHVLLEESVAMVVPDPCIDSILELVDDGDNLRNLVEAVYHENM